MRSASIGAFVFLTLIAASAAAATSLVFEPQSLGLGKQLQEQVLNREITVTNPHDKPVRIIDINTDCGCTVPEIGTRELGAGESTTLTVRFETRSYFGSLRRKITLTTDQGPAVLPITVQVTPYVDWEVAPLPAVMSPSFSASTTSTEITLRYTGEGRAQPITAKANQDWLNPELAPETTPGLFTLTLTKEPGAPVGNNTAVIAVHTDSAATPLITLHVIVPVVSDLRVLPNPLIMPKVPVGTEAVMYFELEGWIDDTEPDIRATKGALRNLGGDGTGVFTFELIYTPEAVGTRSFPLQVWRDGRMELDIPVLARGTPIDQE